ncbi:MAG: hypothetical protein Q9214_000395 [Letrouitia sp. 1 TL-2023]
MSLSKLDEETTSDCVSQDTIAAYDNLEIEDLENEIRHQILAKNELVSKWQQVWYLSMIDVPSQLPKRVERSFAEHRYSLVIPGHSTQELCAIIQISSTLRPEVESKEFGPKVDDAHASDGVKIAHPLSKDQTVLIKKRISEKQSEMNAALKTYLMEASDAGRKGRASELALKCIDIGKACAKVKSVGEARFHFYMACLIVESAYREGAFEFSKTHFHYAKVLEANNWHAEALKIMERQLDVLAEKLKTMGISAKDKKILDLEKRTGDLYNQIRDRVASIYLKNHDFEKVKVMYETALLQLQQDKSNLAATAAQYLERIAFAQVNQQEYEAACRNYERLLNEQSSHHQTILSNLGFLHRRLGRFPEAKCFFEKAINASNSDYSSGVIRLHAQSGLFPCLMQLSNELEIVSQLSQSFIPYIDINASLSSLSHTISPFEGDALDFALSRQLESLLSICSIPICGENGISGIALVDADPLNVSYEGRGA